MSEMLSETRPAVWRQRETIERYRNMSEQEQTRRFQAKWEVCRNVIDHIFEEVQNQPSEVFSKEELYPTLPLVAISVIEGIFGFTTSSPPIESAALHEALLDRVSTGSGSYSPEVAGTLSQALREKVPA